MRFSFSPSSPLPILLPFGLYDTCSCKTVLEKEVINRLSVNYNGKCLGCEASLIVDLFNPPFEELNGLELIRYDHLCNIATILFFLMNTSIMMVV